MKLNDFLAAVYAILIVAVIALAVYQTLIGVATFGAAGYALTHQCKESGR